MKKILHISCLSYVVLASHISSANTNDMQNNSNAQPVDLIIVEDDGNTPMPKKKLRKLSAAQAVTPTVTAPPAAGTDKPASPAAAAQPTTPAVSTPVVPQTTVPSSTVQPTASVQPATAAVVAVQPAAAPVVAAQPAAAPVVAVQPAAAPVVAVQPATAPVVAVQPATAPVVAVQPAAAPVVAAQPVAAPAVVVQPATAPVVAAQPVVVAVAQPTVIDCLHHLKTPISDTEISLWAQYAALKSFEYSFDKLDDQLQKLKMCFTDQGWTGFHEALQQSGNLSIIKSQHLTVSSQISGDPIINRIKENQWSISLPLSVVYQNTQEKFTQSLSVTLVVTKKTATELGIVQLIATVKPETSV